MENKPKFTSGPWFNENGNIRGKWETGEEIGIAMTGVTRFCGDDSGGPRDKRMRAEDSANATLISAAPEMYYALQDLCRFMKMGDRAGALAVSHAWDNAIRALKKAEGQP